MINEDKRPILHIPYSILEKTLEIVSIVGILINAALLAEHYEDLPAKIATHFDGMGNANGWGSKDTLLILPIISLVIYLLITIISKFPHTFNYMVKITEENAEVQYKTARNLMVVLKTEIICIFTYIQWGSINVALGKAKGLNASFIIIVLILLFGTIGFYIFRSIKTNK